MLVALGRVPAWASDPVYDASGFQPGRDYLSSFPFEHVDTVTGNVVLTFTDLTLPGSAGLNFSIVRTYNSQDGKWRFGIGGVPLRFTFDNGGTDYSSISFITPDGATHTIASSTDTGLSQEFWQFTKSTGQLAMPNGIVATYGNVISGDGGYLTKIQDQFGNEIDLNWDGNTTHLLSALQKVGIHETREIDFDNWVQDQVNNITYGSGVWRYVWETVNGTPAPLTELESFTASGWSPWSFTYGNDPAGGVKLTGLTTPNGGAVTYTWGQEMFPTTPSLRVVVESRTIDGRGVPAGTWNFSWQDTGATLVVTGPANKVTYGTTTVNGIPIAGTTTVSTLDGTVVQTDTYTYQAIPNPVQPAPAVATHTITRDGATYTTTYHYSSDNYGDYGQPNEIDESGQLTRTTTLTYRHDFGDYVRGRPASATVTVGGHANTASYTYDDTTGFVKSTTAFGETTQFADLGTGNLMSATDPNGHVTSYSYDWGVASAVTAPETTVTSTINQDGTVASTSQGATVTAYTYDALGRVLSVATNTSGRASATVSYDTGGTTVTQGTNSLRTDVDGFGRTIHTEDAAGVQTHTEYDAAGRVSYQSYPYDASTPEVGESYTYDALNRLVRTVRPDGSQVTVTYAGPTVTTTEQVNGTTSHTTTQTWAYFGDPSGGGRLLSLTDAAGVTWSYTYDAVGNLTSVSSPVAPTRTWTYDDNNRLAEATDPESGTTSYGYDAAGNLTSMQDARGIAVQYHYDANNRLTHVDAPGTAEDVTIAYDASNNPVSIANGTAQTTYTYDTANRLVGQIDAIDGHVFGQSFAYDANDNLTTEIYPGTGRVVTYTYGPQGRITSVSTQLGTNPAKTLASNVVYHASGAIASFTFGNGQTSSVTFDTRQRPAHWVNGPLDVTYAYDYVGNVTSTTDARPGLSASYTYDALDRLTGVTGSGATTFSYDGAGNRLTAGNVNFSYNAQSRLDHLSGGMTGSFTYDASGNLLSDPSGATYTYSALGKMASATVGASVTTYLYGGDGTRRVRRGTDGVDHLFLTGPGGRLVAEYDAAGADGEDAVLDREYLYLGGTLLAAETPVTVTVPAISVSLVTPTADQQIPVGQGASLTAAVSVPGGYTVARVEYYQGGTLVGQATTAPYAVTSPPLANGTATFLARVVTTDGHAVASAPVTVFVY